MQDLCITWLMVFLWITFYLCHLFLNVGCYAEYFRSVSK